MPVIQPDADDEDVHLNVLLSEIEGLVRAVVVHERGLSVVEGDGSGPTPKAYLKRDVIVAFTDLIETLTGDRSDAAAILRDGFAGILPPANYGVPDPALA